MGRYAHYLTYLLPMIARPVSSVVRSIDGAEGSETHLLAPSLHEFRNNVPSAYAVYNDFVKRRPMHGHWARRPRDKRSDNEFGRYEECILSSPIAMDDSQYKVFRELRKFNQSVWDFMPADYRLRTFDEAPRRLSNRTILFLGDSLQKYQASSFACQLAAASPSQRLPLAWAHHVFNEGAEMETRRQPSFCGRLESIGSVVCWWSSGKARGRQLGVAYRVACVLMRLSPRDIVVAGTGVHYKHPTYRGQPSDPAARPLVDGVNLRALRLEADTLRRASESLRWVCPHVMWRETAPQFWPDGFYPANVVNSIEKPDSRVEQCAPWRVPYDESTAPDLPFHKGPPRALIVARAKAVDRAVGNFATKEAGQFNYYNRVLLSALWNHPSEPADTDIPVLSIFWATAIRTMHDMRLELTEQAWRQPYDCTHFTMVGNIYRFWNQMVLTEFIAFEDSFGGGARLPAPVRPGKPIAIPREHLFAGHVVTTLTEKNAIDALGLSAPAIKALEIRYDAVENSKKINGHFGAKELHKFLGGLTGGFPDSCVPFAQGLFKMFDSDESLSLDFGEALVALATFGTYTKTAAQRLCSDIISMKQFDEPTKKQSPTPCDCSAGARQAQKGVQDIFLPLTSKYFPIEAWRRCQTLSCRWERAQLLLQVNQSKANFNNNEKPKPYLLPAKFVDATKLESHPRWDFTKLLNPG
jgi:hypothetical protein